MKKIKYLAPLILVFIATMTMANPDVTYTKGPILSESAMTWEPNGKWDQTAASYVRIHEPTDPAAAATITFKNTTLHWQDEDFVISYNDIDVTVYFKYAVNGERPEGIEVIAPPGYRADPTWLVVPENAEDVVHIYEYLGF